MLLIFFALVLLLVVASVLCQRDGLRPALGHRTLESQILIVLLQRDEMYGFQIEALGATQELNSTA